MTPTLLLTCSEQCFTKFISPSSSGQTFDLYAVPSALCWIDSSKSVWAEVRPGCQSWAYYSIYRSDERSVHNDNMLCGHFGSPKLWQEVQSLSGFFVDLIYCGLYICLYMWLYLFSLSFNSIPNRAHECTLSNGTSSTLMGGTVGNDLLKEIKHIFCSACIDLHVIIMGPCGSCCNCSLYWCIL